MNKKNIITVEYKKCGAVNMARNFVLPTEIHKLGDDVVVIVNRTRINSRMTRLTAQSVENNLEPLQIMKTAVKQMMIEEKKNKSTLIGPKMSVYEIKKVFGNVESMPKNSFAYSE